MKSCTHNRARFIGLPYVGLLLGGLMMPSESHAQSQPILRLRPDGPIAPIHAMRFSPDGQRLYAAGDEKLVQVWRLQDGMFQRSHEESLRQKIGSGAEGKIAALSLSSDGRYLVAGGIGAVRRSAGFFQSGAMHPSSSWSRGDWEDVGTVSVFDTQEGKLHRIKTHLGYVIAAEVVTAAKLDSPYLVTIGNEEYVDDDNGGHYATDLQRSLRITRVLDGKQMRSWTLENTNRSPKLSAWIDPDADNLGDIRVAVTLPENRLADGTAGPGLVWYRYDEANPSSIRKLYTYDADRHRNRDELYVAAHRKIMIVSANGQGTREIDLASKVTTNQLITSIRSIGNASQYAVITLLDLSDEASQYRLNLVNLETKQLVLGKGIPLGNRQNPVVAVDPKGLFVVATADVMRGVQVFEVAQLILNNPTPSQRLEPDFQRIERAGLVNRNGTPTLRIRVRRGTKPHDFELIEDRLRPVASANWPSPGNEISFQRTDTNQYSGGAIRMESSETPIGRVIEGKLLGGKTLAAIACVDCSGEQQPRLSLCDASNGHEIRRLNGHQQQVEGIEFSEDYQFLTTRSPDGLVCVWSLKDIDVERLDRRSAVYRIGLRSDERGDIVPLVWGEESDLGCRHGDVILGLYDQDNQLVQYDSPADYIQAIGRISPSMSARLRVRREGRELDVSEPLEPFVDEHKPLFSFISHPGSETNEQHWLAWHPRGSFQSSGVEIEQRAGWHFNPIEEGKKASFAPFSEYRDDFSGDGLIKELLARGQLPEVWPPLLETSFAARLIGTDGKPVDRIGNVFESEIRIGQMRIAVSDVPGQYVSGVSVSIDAGKPLNLIRSDDDPKIWHFDFKHQPYQARDQTTITAVAHGRRLQGGQQTQSWSLVRPAPPEPKLPSLRIVSPDPFSRVKQSALENGTDLLVYAEVTAEEIPNGVTFAALINGAETGLTEVTRNLNTVKAVVPLKRGINEIAFTMRGEDTSVSSPSIKVEVINPAEVAGIRGKVDDQNNGELTVEVRSIKVPKKEDFRLQVSGDPIDQFELQAPILNGPDRYSIVLSGFKVSDGPNRIDVRLIDRDVSELAHRRLTLNGTPQLHQPEMVVLLDEGQVFDSSEFDLYANVASDDLKEIRCRVNERDIHVPIQPAVALGIRRIPIKVPLNLRDNVIVVTAVSSAGLITRESRRVQRIERPSNLIVQRILGEDGKPIEFLDAGGGKFITKTPAKGANLKLEGMIRLAHEDESQTPRFAIHIRAWVNGFLQSTKRMRPRKEMPFSIPVLLSSSENEVHLDLIGLHQAEDSSAQISIDCAQPSQSQTLHLLVVSTRVRTSKNVEYQRRVLDLLRIKDGAMPAFDEVVYDKYPAQTGRLSNARTVRPLIDHLRMELEHAQAKNNTVLFYFQGEELRLSDGRFCLMTPDASRDEAFITKRRFITSTYLGNQLKDLKCANLLFLDVDSHKDSQQSITAADPQQPRLGVLRLNRQQNTADPGDLVLLRHVSRLIPNVERIGELVDELENQINPIQGIAVNDGIPDSIRGMRFGIGGAF